MYTLLVKTTILMFLCVSQNIVLQGQSQIWSTKNVLLDAHMKW